MAKKKYYWLKLQKDFFKRHDITIIEGLENGKDYILFYMKLLVESIDHEGMLRFSDAIPYNDSMLSSITNTNIDIVRSAVKIFLELGMMERLDDGTLYLSMINSMIGEETDWAEKKRLYREKQKQIGQKRTMSDKSKRLELELEKELEKDIIQEPCEQKIDYDKILDLFKTHCCNKDSKIPIPNSLTPSRKKALNARIKDYNIDGVIAVFNTVGQSDFLTGKKSKWCASFDWILNPTNFAKIIEGNYMNKLKTSKTSSNYNDIEDDESCGF